MRKRAEEKIRDAEDEGIQVIEQKTTEPWLDNVYRPVGNVVTVQPLRCEEVHDDEYETERDEYLNHSLDILEQNRRKKAI
ncbi:DNA transposition protein [Escherichia coli]|nr:DNA transposition protein [Escherichia coli]